MLCKLGTLIQVARRVHVYACAMDLPVHYILVCMCGLHAFTRSLAELVCHAAGERAAAEWTFTLLLVALTMCGVCTYVA